MRSCARCAGGSNRGIATRRTLCTTTSRGQREGGPSSATVTDAQERVPPEVREKIAAAAKEVLDVRKLFMDADPECSLGILYMPDTMPPDLLFAHAHLDALVDKAYGLSPSCTDADRVAHLFKLYASLTENE